MIQPSPAGFAPRDLNSGTHDPAPATLPLARPCAAPLILAPMVGWCVFLALFALIYPHIGMAAGTLSLLLVGFLAWFGGLRYGLLQSLIGSFVTSLSLQFLFHLPQPPGVTAVLLFVSLALTWMVGHLRDIHARLRVTQQALLSSQSTLRYQAEHDVLTGLHNRRHFNDRLGAELSRAGRYSLPLTVVLLDVDCFKQINDRYSHAVGDEVLRVLGRLLAEGVREVDCVARYGGEEFALCLPSTEAAGAVVLCERLRARVEAYDWSEVQPGMLVTVSGGMYCGPLLGTPERMLAEADHRLYLAKEGGRNRIQRCDVGGPSN